MSGNPDESLATRRYQAELYIRAGDYLKALEVSREVVAADPEAPGGYVLAGRAHAALEQFDEAKAAYQKALSFDPASDFVHYCLSVMYRAMAVHPMAEKHIRKALAAAPGNAGYWIELGLVCFARNNLDEARRCALKALKLDPENATALNLQAMALPRGAPRSAEVKLYMYFKALEADPEDPYIYNNIAVTYLDIKDYARAEEYFRQALLLNPGEKLFRTNLYLTLKHRSIVYRLLRAPGDACWGALEFLRRRRAAYLVMVVVLLSLYRAASHQPWLHPAALWGLPLVGLVVWFILFWPLLRLYEFMILDDIRTLAREVGPARGGPFGVYGWPVWVRMLIFFVALCGLWTGVGLAAANPALRPYAVGVVAVGIVGLVIVGIVVSARERRRSPPAPKRRDAPPTRDRMADFRRTMRRRRGEPPPAADGPEGDPV